MSEEKLRIEYVRLDRARSLLWRENPKLHDLQVLAESLRRHGMRDAPAFDAAIQEGGGIVDGNGRVETLAWIHDQGQEPPRGIALDGDGMWCVPVQFGVDAESEAAAKAYALDANNIGLLGGEFSPWDVARMWDDEGYLALLGELAEADALPVSVDADVAEALLTPVDYDELWKGMPEFEQEDILDSALTCLVRFRTEEDRDEFKELIGAKLQCWGKKYSTWFPPQDFDQMGRDLEFTDEP